MKHLKNTGLLVVAMTALISSGTLMAEPGGLLNGRSADISRMPEKSIEGGAFLGETDDVDFTIFAARFNYKVNPKTVAYVDLGQAEYEIGNDADGLIYGVGAFHQMDDVLANTDFGIHASFHKSSLERDGSSRSDISLSSIMVEAQFSGREAINENGNMFWNASVGLNRYKVENDSEVEPAFGGGVTVSNAEQSGEFYAGILFVDGLGFGAGYRHFLK